MVSWAPCSRGRSSAGPAGSKSSRWSPPTSLSPAPEDSRRTAVVVGWVVYCGGFEWFIVVIGWWFFGGF